ncbi:partial Response regulator PleD, partial [Candidatus Brocadiaceae bacterium]
MIKIVIVDDNEDNLYMLESLLYGEKYKVLSARNGEEALQLVQTEMPDLIISDILMPVMDGYTLCKECKKDNTLYHIPFIFYTAT